MEIDKAEFKRLRDLLDGVEPEEPKFPNDGSHETPEMPEEPMSLGEMRTKIKKLEKQLTALSQWVAMYEKK